VADISYSLQMTHLDVPSDIIIQIEELNDR